MVDNHVTSATGLMMEASIAKLIEQTRPAAAKPAE
jgi:hypothetical protein